MIDVVGQHKPEIGGLLVVELPIETVGVVLWGKWNQICHRDDLLASNQILLVVCNRIC